MYGKGWRFRYHIGRKINCGEKLLIEPCRNDLYFDIVLFTPDGRNGQYGRYEQ